MSILLFRFTVLCFDLLIGFLCKWWSFADAKAYIIGWFRLYRSIFLMAVYLDLVVLGIIYFRFPDLWQRIVEWLNLYLVLGGSGVSISAPTTQIWERYSLSGGSRRVLKDLSTGGMLSRNREKSLLWLLYMVVTSLITHWNRHIANIVRDFGRRLQELHAHGGNKYVTIYLKACHILLQQAIARSPSPDSRALGAAVSRTARGIPRIIPRHHRTLILKGRRAYIRLWLSLFSLYRVLEFPSRLSLATILTPTDSWCTSSEIASGLSDFIYRFPHILFRYIYPPTVRRNVIRKKPLRLLPVHRTWLGEWSTGKFMTSLHWAPFQIVRSSPTTWSEGSSEPGGPEMGLTSTSYISVSRASRLWLREVMRGTALGGALQDWFDRVTPPSPRNVQAGLRRILEDNIFPRTTFGPSRSILFRREPEYLGKLGLKIEAAGKVRVFAMVDCFTQWLLQPLHKSIMSLLRWIPQDGTFNQLAPVRRLLKGPRSGLFSYDLSSATDRLPVTLQKMILRPILGSAADTWRTLLVGRPYQVPRIPGGVLSSKLPKSVVYAVGQPMGALSSWAMLALTHHVILQYAASRCAGWRGEARRHPDLLRSGGSTEAWFKSYAILGDDIVIGDREVALEYLRVVDSLGVKVSFPKSLVSSSGRALEFAKKFFAPRDCSGIPIREILAARDSLSGLIEFIRKYRLSINQTLRFAGFGYRNLGGLNRPYKAMSLRLRNLLLALTHPNSPFGCPSLADWYRSVGWYQLSKIDLQRTLQAMMDSEFDAQWSRLAALSRGHGFIHTIILGKDSFTFPVGCEVVPNLFGSELKSRRHRAYWTLWDRDPLVASLEHPEALKQIRAWLDRERELQPGIPVGQLLPSVVCAYDPLKVAREKDSQRRAALLRNPGARYRVESSDLYDSLLREEYTVFIAELLTARDWLIESKLASKPPFYLGMLAALEGNGNYINLISNPVDRDYRNAAADIRPPRSRLLRFRNKIVYRKS